MKKVISIFMVLIITLFLSSCNKKEEQKTNIEYPIFIFYQMNGRYNDFVACFIDEKNNICVASLNEDDEDFVHEIYEVKEYNDIKTISDFKNLFKNYEFEEGIIIPTYVEQIYEDLQAISNDEHMIFSTDNLHFKYGNSKWQIYHIDPDLLTSPNMHYPKDFIDDTVDVDRIKKELQCHEIFDILNYVSENHIDSIYD